MIAIIDYGLGNLKSVQNALNFLGAESIFVKSPSQLGGADVIILPGVGAFGDGMRGLKKFKKPLISALNSGVPFLGICLGFQLLFEESEESGEVKGLSYFSGRVKKLNTNLKLPQIGWNQLKINSNSRLFKNIPLNSYVYFVHSFAPIPSNSEIISATCNYGADFAAAIEQKNIFATQFHPEKSGEIGLKILRNFLELTGAIK